MQGIERRGVADRRLNAFARRVVQHDRYTLVGIGFMSQFDPGAGTAGKSGQLIVEQLDDAPFVFCTFINAWRTGNDRWVDAAEHFRPRQAEGKHHGTQSLRIVAPFRRRAGPVAHQLENRHVVSCERTAGGLCLAPENYGEIPDRGQSFTAAFEKAPQGVVRCTERCDAFPVTKHRHWRKPRRFEMLNAGIDNLRLSAEPGVAVKKYCYDRRFPIVWRSDASIHPGQVACRLVPQLRRFGMVDAR